ncbi:MAG: FtsX-like permease family protein [Dysgonamonadaceae bacterium]|nr:FtsX-like permease family protein [Dysgonamonadaceae bacterium]
MIQHIFKIIWNERKTNVWLLLEYIIIFCILWFCTDYLYTMLHSYFSHKGYDLKYVYDIQMQKKPISGDMEIDDYALAMTFLERINRHPGIETVAFSTVSVPYQPGTWTTRYYINGQDSIFMNDIQRKRVSSGYFDVFRINVEGDIFDWQDYTDREKIIITPLRGDRFGNHTMLFPISEIHSLDNRHWQSGEIERVHQVAGTADRIIRLFHQPAMSSLFEPLQREDVNLQSNNISVRVKPEADKGFAERFVREMREQLTIEPYFLSSVTSAQHLQTQLTTFYGIRNHMNSTYAITSFLIVNIFLGILGAFWFRTQSRRSEIGLRLALGSSRRKVQGMMLLETMMLLSIASVAATIICLHLSNPEILRMLGIPFVDKARWGIGNEQNFINFGITFGFLALISMLAVWHPARQAAKIMPAETLHEE